MTTSSTYVLLHTAIWSNTIRLWLENLKLAAVILSAVVVVVVGFYVHCIIRSIAHCIGIQIVCVWSNWLLLYVTQCVHNAVKLALQCLVRSLFLMSYPPCMCEIIPRGFPSVHSAIVVDHINRHVRVFGLCGTFSGWCINHMCTELGYSGNYLHTALNWWFSITISSANRIWQSCIIYIQVSQLLGPTM